jgi:hypothetical protein
MCCWHQHNTRHALALMSRLHKYNHTIASRNTLVLTIQAVLAIGRDSHCYAWIDKAIKGTADGAQMDFSWQNLEQKWPVFWPYTQCNDSKETAHTWWCKEGFPGDRQVLERGIMVTDGRDEEHWSKWNPMWNPTWNLNGTDGLRRLFSHASTIQIHIEKSCRLDNFMSHGLEIMSETTTKPMWKWNFESFAFEASCSIGRRAGCHNDGIKGLLLKFFYSFFKSFWSTMQ